MRTRLAVTVVSLVFLSLTACDCGSVPPARIVSVTPDRGPATGGTTIEISGEHFEEGEVTVELDGVRATEVDVLADDLVRAVTPAHAAGAVRVSVLQYDQRSSLENGFTYVDATITAVEPDSGPIAGGTTIEIRGTDFNERLTVELDGTPATDVEVLAGTLIRAVTPAHAEGAVDVTVVQGAARTTRQDAFTYVDGPSITGITPDEGPSTGGTLAVIDGDGFVDGATVTFDGIPASSVDWVDAHTLSVTTPPGPVKQVDVRVENPDQQSAELARGYTYLPDSVCGRVILPEYESDRVPVTGGLLVQWEDAIDFTSLAERVELREVRPGGEVLDVDVVPEGDRAVRIVPAKSLRFASSYVLEIGSVRTSQGEPCSQASIAFSTVAPNGVRPRPLESAPATDIALIGTTALTVTPSYRGVQIYDVADPVRPMLVGDLVTSTSPFGISIDGDRAYLASGFEGALVLDVSDPRRPVEIGRIGTPGDVFDAVGFSVGARGNLVVVADGPAGVRIFDATDPEAPRELSRIAAPDDAGSIAMSVSVSGDRMAVAFNTGGFAVYSIADPQAPTLVLSGPAAGASARSTQLIDLSGDVLVRIHDLHFVESSRIEGAARVVVDDVLPCNDCLTRWPTHFTRAGNRVLIGGAREGVKVVDIDSTGDLASFPPPSAWRPLLSPTSRLATDGSTIFAVGSGGLSTFALAGTGGPEYLDANAHGTMFDLYVDGDDLFVAADLQGVLSYRIDGDAPVLLGRMTTPTANLVTTDIASTHVLALGDTLVVSDGRGGIATFRRDAAAAHELLGTVNGRDRFGALAPIGDLLLACEDNAGASVIDVSSVDEPRILSPVTFSELEPGLGDQCFDVVVDEATHVAYFGSRGGLYIVDFSDPMNARILSQFVLRAEDRVVAVAQVGGLLYAGTATPDYEGRNGTTSRLQVFDTSDPTAPERIYVSDDLGAIGDLVVTSDIVFVAAGDLGVFVYDVSTPSAPYLETVIETPGHANRLRATADSLYLTQSGGGLAVIDTGPLPIAR